jgi:hypothetical protein
VLAVLLLGGCAWLPDFRRTPGPPADAAPGVVAPGEPAAVAARSEHASESDGLLLLAAQVIEAESAEARRGIEALERQRFDADPTRDNLLRLAVVRAMTATQPAELAALRRDLRDLSSPENALPEHQRHVTLVTLRLVEERLSLLEERRRLAEERQRLGEQISELQEQIDLLTEIEASLKGGILEDVEGSGP